MGRRVATPLFTACRHSAWSVPKYFWISVIVGLSFTYAPLPALAQSWEVDAAWFFLDYGDTSGPEPGVDQLPAGGTLGGRHILGRTFIQLDFGYGRGQGLGSVCGGGLVLPGASGCSLEQVRYASALATFSVGAPLAVDVAREWALRLRPRAGLGFVLSEELGLTTGNQHSEMPLVGFVGLAADVTYRLGRDRTTALGFFAGGLGLFRKEASYIGLAPFALLLSIHGLTLLRFLARAAMRKGAHATRSLAIRAHYRERVESAGRLAGLRECAAIAAVLAGFFAVSPATWVNLSRYTPPCEPRVEMSSPTAPLPGNRATPRWPESPTRALLLDWPLEWRWLPLAPRARSRAPMFAYGHSLNLPGQPRRLLPAHWWYPRCSLPPPQPTWCPEPPGNFKHRCVMARGGSFLIAW